MYALYGISPEKQEVDKFYMIEDFVYALKEIYDRDIKPIVNLHEEAQISFKR
jgi:hypothetical protein